jgi:hypothetical protein
MSPRLLDRGRDRAQASALAPSLSRPTLRDAVFASSMRSRAVVVGHRGEVIRPVYPAVG